MWHSKMFNYNERKNYKLQWSGYKYIEVLEYQYV